MKARGAATVRGWQRGDIGCGKLPSYLLQTFSQPTPSKREEINLKARERMRR
jgi:hypothetical protein